MKNNETPIEQPRLQTNPKAIDIVMALKGQMYWRDLAKQLAEVWWRCSEIGANLQHGDLDEDISFSVVCVEHGGQVFHGDTPMHAWEKARKWLMSPSRPTNFQ
jgi:hypothetical protein